MHEGRSAIAATDGLALTVTLENGGGGAPSIADLALVLSVLTRLFAIPSGAAGRPQIPAAHEGPALSLAVAEVDGRPLVISAGADAALRSWYLDGDPGPLHLARAHVDAIVTVATPTGPMLIGARGDALASRIWRARRVGASRCRRSVTSRRGAVRARAVRERRRASAADADCAPGGRRSADAGA